MLHDVLPKGLSYRNIDIADNFNDVGYYAPAQISIAYELLLRL